MLEIKKVKKPEFFDTWIENKEEYSHSLREYMLREEQHDVCCYCEKAVTAHNKDSHIEHIRPRDKFPKLTHQYNNLVVSCQTSGRCGNAKGNKFNEHFIVPTEENPGDHLTYSPNGEIRPIDKSKKAMETIDILKLNAPALREARRALFKMLMAMRNSIAFDDFEKYFNEYPTFLTYFKDHYL